MDTWVASTFWQLWIVSVSHSVVSNPMNYNLSPWNFPGQNTGVGWHSLLQGIFPTQGLNPGLLHCRQILYCLSHQESPTVNHAAINISVQMSLQVPDFNSFRYTPRSGLAGSCDNFILKFLRSHHTFFHISRTVLHSQQCLSVPLPPHPCQHMFSVVRLFLIIAIQVV